MVVSNSLEAKVLKRSLREVSIDLASPAVIAWYCLLMTCVVPVLTCLVWCWYQKFRSNRRALAALEHERQLEAVSRMVANIEAYSEAEKSKREKPLRSAVRRHVRVKKGSELDKEIRTENENAMSTSCRICLESFEIGDPVAEFPCLHAFHEDCIVSWLVTRDHALCPCCRRSLMCIPAKASQASTTAREDSSSLSEEV